MPIYLAYSNAKILGPFTWGYPEFYVTVGDRIFKLEWLLENNPYAAIANASLASEEFEKRLESQEAPFKEKLEVVKKELERFYNEMEQFEFNLPRER